MATSIPAEELASLGDILKELKAIDTSVKAVTAAVASNGGAIVGVGAAIEQMNSLLVANGKTLTTMSDQLEKLIKLNQLPVVTLNGSVGTPVKQ